MKEFLGELAGEAVLTVVACLAVVGLALAFVWGWEHDPLVTGGAGGALLAFLGYGGWELSRPTESGRRGRLAGSAAATFAVAAVFIAYAWSCDCF
ncbi:lysine transporter LysE [Streptomyces sp. CB02400]|uniref:lysine transporter LysE n=1 Tax=unclassified Streptomyces TaxID=2593676 RepID=UPI0011611AE3|nr:lysine transporter LysE [Streptomyces sp. CB02400]